MLVLSAAVGAALAYWTSSGQFTAGASLTTLQAPIITTATPGNGTVTLAWSAITPPEAGAVRYYVTRDGGSPSSGCPSFSARSTVTSCTDTGVSIGRHTYTVTAVWRSWSATSEQKAVTITSSVVTHFQLEAAGTAPTAGEADSLTIVAEDAGNNIVASYAGSHNLVFGGAASAPDGTQPTVTGEAGGASRFGEATAIKFSEGKATVSGSANGVMRLYRAGEAHITVSEGSLNNGAGLLVTVKAGAFKSLRAWPVPAAPQAGSAFEVKIAALDEWNNVITSYARTHKLQYSGAESSPNGRAPEYSASTEPTFTGGEATVTGFRFYKAATTTLTVTEEVSGHSGTASFTVTPAPPASLALATNPAELTVGLGAELSIRALDPYGNLATSYANGVHTLTFSGPSAGPSGREPYVLDHPGAEKHLGLPTEISFAGGEAKVEAGHNGLITLFRAGETQLKVSDGTLNNGTGLTIKVKAGVATSFKLAAPVPAEPEAGQAFNVAITAVDAGGNTATTYGGAAGESKTLTYSGPEASPNGKAPEYPATVSFKEGVGTATAIKLYRAGATTLTAKEGTKEGAFSFTVKPAAFKNFALTPNPAEPQVGQAFEVKLRALDEWSNVLTTYARTHKLQYSGAESSPNGKAPEYSASTEPTFTGGEATVTGFRFYKAATTTLTVTEEVSGHAGSATFTVKAGVATSFKLAAPVPAEPEAGEAFNVTITALDAGGNTAASYGGAAGESKTLTYSGPEASPSGKAPEYPATVSFKEGVGTATAIKLYRAGATTLTAKEGTKEGAISFTVKAGVATSFKLAAPVPAEPEAGQAFNVAITALDAGGNTATTYGGATGESKTLTYSGPEASPSGKAPEYPTSVSFKEGVGTATAIKLYRAGATTLTAKEGTKEGAVSFTVKAGVATSFKLAAPVPAEPEAGQAFNVAITALDAGGNTATTYGGAAGESKTLTYSGPEASPSGKAPEYPTSVSFKEGVGTATAIKLYRAGATTLTAKEGTKEGAVSFTVKAGAFKSFALTPNPAEPQVGQAFEVKLRALDEWNNVLTSYTRTHKLQYSGAESSPNGKAPEYSASSEPTFTGGEATLTGFRFYKAAATTLTVTEEVSGHAGSATFTVKAGAATSFKLAAPVPAEPEAGQAFNVTITAVDAGGNTAASYGGAAGESKTLTYSGPEPSSSGKAPEYPATVSFKEGVGTATAIKLYKPGATTLTAKEGAKEGSVAFTIKTGPATGFKLSAPVPAEPEAGQAFNVTITAVDAGGNTVITYGGAAGESKTLTYSGPEASPSGKAPEYPATVSFKEGVGTATAIKLYRAGATTLTAKEGTKEGAVSFTVKTGAFKSLGVAPNPAEPQAGSPFEVKLAAWDEWHNVVASYTRTHKLQYSGAEPSPSGKAPEYSANTEPVFSAGQATLTGFRFYKAAATTLKVTEEVTGNTGSGTFAVAAGAAKQLSLAAAATEAGSGQADNLTITALDEWANTATSYGGASGESKNLTFEGAGASPNGAEPTVTNEAGAATKFGQATAVKFTAGTATVSGTSNGVLTLYKVEEAHVKVKEGTLNNGAGLLIKVKPGAATAFRLSAPVPAEPTAGSAFNVTITAIDAGGNTATPYGGAAGENKTIAYSGPESSPTGTAPEYPATATTVNFKEGVGTATAIKLYRAGVTALTASEGTKEGIVSFTVKPEPASSLTPVTGHFAWERASATAGTLSTPCLFTCEDLELGLEATFRAHIAVTDQYGNIESNLGPGHEAHVDLESTGRGTITGASVVIPATGLAESAGEVEFTSPTKGGGSANLTARAETGTAYKQAKAKLHF
jgi:hypothetical protein